MRKYVVFIFFLTKNVQFICRCGKKSVLLRVIFVIMVECEQKAVSSACRGCALSDHCQVVEDDRFTRRQRWPTDNLTSPIMSILAAIRAKPFILLAGVIVLTDWLTDNEYIIGGAALGVVALYYLVLFAVKPKV